MIDVETKLIGLLGYPLKHSLSPIMHNTAFKSLDINYYYLPLEIEKKGLKAVVNGIKYMNFVGFNVTKPYKTEIIGYLDEIDEMAQKIGAVNTVKINGNDLIGYNTDGKGFIKSFKEDLREDIESKEFIILGAGGAGRAISFSLAINQAKRIIIFDTTLDKSRQVAQDVNDSICYCADYRALSQENLKSELERVDVLINANSTGMYPEKDKMPLSKDLLNDNLIVCDLIYNPIQTRLLEEAEIIGCKNMNGIGMFLNQGIASFKLWTNFDPPRTIMKEKVLKKLNRSAK